MFGLFNRPRLYKVPSQITRELFINTREILEYIDFLIGLFTAAGLFDEADTNSLSRERLHRLAELEVHLMLAQILSSRLKGQKERGEKRLGEINLLLKSSKAHVARKGPLFAPHEQLLLSSLSLVSGLGFIAIASLFLAPLIAVIVGLILGTGYFGFWQQQLLGSFWRSVSASELAQGERRQLTAQAQKLSRGFIIFDSIMTALFLAITYSFWEGENPFVWIVPAVAGLAANVTFVGTLHHYATRLDYEIRDILREYRRGSFVAIREIEDWYRQLIKEKQDIVRANKEAGKKEKDLLKFLSSKDSQRRKLLLEIGDVSYYRRIAAALNEFAEGDQLPTLFARRLKIEESIEGNWSAQAPSGSVPPFSRSGTSGQFHQNGHMPEPEIGNSSTDSQFSDPLQ